MSNHKVAAIVQARMGATRLPGKPLLEVLGRPLLDYQIERMRRAKLLDEIVVATTTSPKDRSIVWLCEQLNLPYHCGSEEDVLSRYYEAAREHQADIVVRITGDCPLIDPGIIDEVVAFYLQHSHSLDYASNAMKRTYPRGLDVEIFSFQALERAYREAAKPQEREHVTPYFYCHPELFALANYASDFDLSFHRWTVDTQEDFLLISQLIAALYPEKPDFALGDIVAILGKHPEWVLINAHIPQKPWHLCS